MKRIILLLFLAGLFVVPMPATLAEEPQGQSGGTASTANPPPAPTPEPGPAPTPATTPAPPTVGSPSPTPDPTQPLAPTPPPSEERTITGILVDSLSNTLVIRNDVSEAVTFHIESSSLLPKHMLVGERVTIVYRELPGRLREAVKVTTVPAATTARRSTSKTADTTATLTRKQERPSGGSATGNEGARAESKVGTVSASKTRSEGSRSMDIASIKGLTPTTTSATAGEKLGTAAAESGTPGSGTTGGTTAGGTTGSEPTSGATGGGTIAGGATATGGGTTESGTNASGATPGAGATESTTAANEPLQTAESGTGPTEGDVTASQEAGLFGMSTGLLAIVCGGGILALALGLGFLSYVRNSHRADETAPTW